MKKVDWFTNYKNLRPVLQFGFIKEDNDWGRIYIRTKRRLYIGPKTALYDRVIWDYNNAFKEGLDLWWVQSGDNYYLIFEKENSSYRKTFYKDRIRSMPIKESETIQEKFMEILL